MLWLLQIILCCVCVLLEFPVIAEVLSNNSAASMPTMVIVACLVAALLVLLVLVIAIVLVAWRRRVRRHNALSFHPIDEATLPPIKKRVVLMHSNMLYASDPSSSVFTSSEKGKFLLGSNSSGTQRTPLLISQIAPQVRIEPCCTRSRLSSELTSMSEYEIPLDAKWEFPRERY